MTETPELFPSTEIVGAILTHQSNSHELNDFANDPHSMLASNFNLDFSNIEFNIVNNTANDVNLGLPFYTEVETIQAELLKDERLQNISGGEIIIALILMGGTLAGIAATGTWVGGAVGAAIAGGIAGGVAAVAIGTGLGINAKNKAPHQIRIGAATPETKTETQSNGK